jgi:hypothetical protein
LEKKILGDKMKQLDRPWKCTIKKRLDKNLILKKITPWDHRIITGDLISATGKKDFAKRIYIGNDIGLLDIESLFCLGYLGKLMAGHLRIIICA